MKKQTMSMVAIALFVFNVVGVAGAIQIDTTRPFTGAWTPFGEPNTATYGQSFTVSSDNVLDSFSLYLTNYVNDPVHFKAYIYEWSGTMARGSALFSSVPQTFTGSAFSSPVEFEFTTGGVPLEVGKTYVAFLSASELFDGKFSTATMPWSGVFGSDVYSGGKFVYYNNGNNFSLLTTETWDGYSGWGDVWFKASLSDGETTVPEPATILFLGSGLLGLIGFRRKLRK